MENSAIVPATKMTSVPELPTELWLQIYGNVIDDETTVFEDKFQKYLESAKIDHRIYNAAMDVFLDNFELEVHFEIKIGGPTGRMPLPQDPVVDSDLFNHSLKVTHNTHEFWNSTFAARRMLWYLWSGPKSPADCTWY